MKIFMRKRVIVFIYTLIIQALILYTLVYSCWLPPYLGLIWAFIFPMIMIVIVSLIDFQTCTAYFLYALLLTRNISIYFYLRKVNLNHMYICSGQCYPAHIECGISY